MSDTLHQIQEFFLGALKKSFVEENAVKPFLNSIFGVLSTSTEDEGTLQTYFNKDLSDETSLTGKSLVTLRNMIDAVPFDPRVIPVTVEFVETAICSWSAGPRKGACLAIAAIASCERVDSQCLNRLLAHVAVGIKDYHPAVRSAALFALHRFFFNIKVSLKLHADILEEPIYECLTMLCYPPKSPVSPPKIPDYVGTLFETVILLCRADDGNVVEEMFLSFLPKLIHYLLLAARYNVEFRERGIDILHEVARSTEEKTVSPVSQTAKSIETFLKSRLSDALSDKLTELWGIFEKLEGDLHQEEFDSLAWKCLTMVVAAIRIVIADRVSLRWAYDLLLKLKFFLKPEAKEVFEGIVNRQDVSVASVDGSSKVEKAVKRIIRKKHKISFVSLKKQEKSTGYSEMGIEEKLEAEERVGKAFKPIGNFVNGSNIFEGSREAPIASDNAINSAKPPFADEDYRSPTSNVQGFYDMLALSPETVPRENEISLPSIPSPPPPPTITLLHQPVPPSSLYTFDAALSESHAPSSRSRTPSNDCHTPSTRSHTLSFESCTLSIGSRAPSRTTAALGPTCPSATRPTPDSPSSLAAMWLSPSPPRQSSIQACPSPLQPPRPCPPLDLPMACPTRLSMPAKQASPADQSTLRGSTGNSASGNENPGTKTFQTGYSDSTKIVKEEMIDEEEQLVLNIDETALEGLKALQDFQSDFNGLLNEETENDGQTIAPQFQDKRSASERRQQQSILNTTSKCDTDSLSDNFIKEDFIGESFLIKEESLDADYDSVEELQEENALEGQGNSPSPTREISYRSSPSKRLKSAESKTPAEDLCLTISLPVIKTEQTVAVPAGTDSFAPVGSNKRVLRSSTQKTAGGDFLPIPTDFPPTVSAYPLQGNAFPSTCDPCSPGTVISCVSSSTQEEPVNLTVNKTMRQSASDVLSCVSSATKMVTSDVLSLPKRTSDGSTREMLSSHLTLSIDTPSPKVTNSSATIDPETQKGASTFNKKTQMPALRCRESAISHASMPLSGNQRASVSIVTLNPFTRQVRVQNELVTQDKIVPNSMAPGISATQTLFPSFDDAKLKKNVVPPASTMSAVDVSACLPSSCVKINVTQKAVLCPQAATQPAASTGNPCHNNSVPSLVQCVCTSTQPVAPTTIPCANKSALDRVPNISATHQVAPTTMPGANTSNLAPIKVQRMCAATHLVKVGNSNAASCIGKPTLNVLPITVHSVKAKTQKVAPFDGSPNVTSMVPSTNASLVPRKERIVSQVVNKTSEEKTDESEWKLKLNGKKQSAGSEAPSGDIGLEGNSDTFSDPRTFIGMLSDDDKSRRQKIHTVQSKSCPHRRHNKSRSIRNSRLALVSYSSSDTSLSSSGSPNRRSPCSSPNLSRKLGSSKRQCCDRDLVDRKRASSRCRSDNQSRSKCSRSRSRSKRSRSRSGSRRRSKRSCSRSGSRRRSKRSRSRSGSRRRSKRSRSRSGSRSRSKRSRSRSGSRRRSKRSCSRSHSKRSNTNSGCRTRSERSRTKYDCRSRSKRSPSRSGSRSRCKCSLSENGCRSRDVSGSKSSNNRLRTEDKHSNSQSSSSESSEWPIESACWDSRTESPLSGRTASCDH